MMYNSQKHSPQRALNQSEFSGIANSSMKLSTVKEIQALANNCNNDFDFFLKNYIEHANEKGNLYTWGSGEMGQLGYSSRIIQLMPKDRDGYPFQPNPLEIEQLRDKDIYQIAGGDGHTVAVDIQGKVYSWGASACGQLGLSSMKDLPTDIEGYPYQPTPRLVELLQHITVSQIACGDAHTVALTNEGRLYSWGGGGCGQLGHPDTASMPKDEDGCPYQPKPKLIVALKQMEVREVSCGKAHTVAVLQNGHLYSWGAGACGQLGHPDTSSFPADEDGYPYQPIPRCVIALKQYKLIHASCGDVHTMVLTEGGEIYCFGGGSCGQLGFGDILQMPLDVDRCPFMPVPKRIESLQGFIITQLACGDSHSMALTKEGFVFAWGEASFGQLGLDDIRELPTNNEHKPYQPYPTRVQALINKKIVAISCGETHTQCLTDSGHLYSFGANGCGQLGQFTNNLEKRRRGSFEEVTFPRITNSLDQQLQYNNGFESSNSRQTSPRDSNSSRNHNINSDDNQNVAMNTPLMSPPPLYSANDYGIEKIEQVPKLVKSLMHKKVIRISSGGVHNICIVEAKPTCILRDIYTFFMQGKFTNLVFKGFYQTANISNDQSGQNSGVTSEDVNQTMRSQCSSDEDMQQDEGADPNSKLKDDLIINKNTSSGTEKHSLSEAYWREKQKISSQLKIRAHVSIIASKSSYFYKILKEKQMSITQKDDEIVIDFEEQVLYEAFRKIIDYFYLDDLNILDGIQDSTEMLEIIKLSKLFKLDDLFRAAEIHFQDTLVNWFDNSSIFSLKLQNLQKRRLAGPVIDEVQILAQPPALTSLQETPVKQQQQKELLRARVTQQANQNAINQNKDKKRKILSTKMSSTLQGMMFLPDGRVLIMDKDLYQKTLEQSIVIDLFESSSANNLATSSSSELREEEEKQGSTSQVTNSLSTNSRVVATTKDNNRKQSQANQKPQRLLGDNTSNPNVSESLSMSQMQQQHETSIVMDSAQTHNSKDFLVLLNQKDFSDITLMVEGKPIYCHQVILASRSVYFEAQFSHDFSEKDTRVATYNDVPYEFFIMFLRHIYSDNVKVESKYVYELLSLADRFSVGSFKKKCEQILAQYITVDSVCQIFKYANKFNCERLQTTCLLFIEECYNDVLTSAGFEDLDKEEIIKIIRIGNDPKKRKRTKGAK